MSPICAVYVVASLTVFPRAVDDSTHALQANTFWDYLTFLSTLPAPPYFVGLAKMVGVASHRRVSILTRSRNPSSFSAIT